MHALLQTVLTVHGQKVQLLAWERHLLMKWHLFLWGMVGGVAGGCWNIYRALDQEVDASLFVLFRTLWTKSGLLVLMAGLGGLAGTLITLFNADATATISGLGFWGIYTMFARARSVKGKGKAKGSDEDEYAHR
jgi:hypothetical protein